MRSFLVFSFVLLFVLTIEGRGYYWEYLRDLRTSTSTTTTTPSPVAYQSGSYFSHTYRRPWTPPSSRMTWRTGSIPGGSYQTSQASSINYWNAQCRYPRETCGIENQAMMGSNFEPGYTQIGSSYEKVMILDSQAATSSAARLITPYIKARNWDDICLTLEYLISDDGVEKLTVIQQDRHETRSIYNVEGEEKKGKWRMAKMDIIMRKGITRYFIEARINSGRKGVIMIRSLEYEVGRCSDSSSSQNSQFMRRGRLMNKYWKLNE